jgi:urea carboxylase system permease
VILGTALIVFTTVVNAIGVKLMARINSAGVIIELVAAVLLVLAFALNITRGPDVITETQGLGADWELGYLGAFLAASLASAYVMYGFDTASSLGEESLDPRRNAPKAILRALIASFLIGGAILLFAMMAVTDINSEELGVGGLQYIVLDVLGDTVGDIFLWAVVIAITVCCLAVHTAAIRMMFAMARDNNLPGGAQLARVHPKTRTPIIPSILIGVLAIAILVVNIRQPQIFVVITSLGIIMIYIAYLLVTIPMLRKRLRGEWPGPDAPKGYFSLGRWGLPVNILAVLWGLFMAINLAWPREEVYGATSWVLTWIAPIFIGIVALAGLLWYRLRGRHHVGVLAEHSAGASTPAEGAEPPQGSVAP